MICIMARYGSLDDGLARTASGDGTSPNPGGKYVRATPIRIQDGYFRIPARSAQGYRI
jgi:hypothetical protein